ncbi:hypothetical protein ACFFRR_004289 [Megaselia abdita]
MGKTTNWKLLPSDVVQNILQYSEVDDVQNFMITCKQWYFEADYYLKDKVWLCIDKTDTLKNVKACKRRFENIKLKNTSPTDIRVIKALLRRDVKYADRVTTGFLRFDNLSRLISVVEEIGSNLKSLTLHNQSSNFNKRKRSMKNEVTKNAVITNVSTVEELRIDCANDNILPISKSFSNLKYLELFSVTSSAVLENFIASNPFLESLNVKFISFQKEVSLENLGNLKVFSTNDPILARSFVKQPLQIHTLDISCVFTDELCSNIRANFKDLQKLTISADDSSYYSDKALNDIWRMTKLSTFSFNGIFDTESWNRSFRAPVKTINSLSLQGKYLVEDIVTNCIKNFQNVTKFEVYDVAAPSFRYIQEMAENFKNLEFLGLSLVDEMSFGRLLKYKPWKTPGFEKLKELKLRSNFESPTDIFFKYFKAPNLETVSFDLSAIHDSDEVAFSINIRKVLKLIHRNSPDVEITLDTEQLQKEMLRMRELIFHARSL